MKTFRLALLGSVVAGIGSMAVIDASAADVEKSVKMYGFVNRMIGIEDDGNSTEIRHFDNSIASSRFGIKATAKSANITIGARFEWQFQSNSNSAFTPNQQQGVGTGEGDGPRWSDISFATKYGTLFMGQGDSASNSIQTSDLSGTGIALAVGEPLSRGMGMMPDTSNGTRGTGTGGSFTSRAYQVGDFIPNLDGNSRTNRLRYDTPRFAGLRLSISSDGGGRMGYQAHYSGAVADFKIVGAIGYANNSSVNPSAYGIMEENVGGSISVLHSSGVSLTYAHAMGTNSGPTTSAATIIAPIATGTRGEGHISTHYGKIGFQRDFSSVGKTYLGVDFLVGYDGITDGDYGSKVGVGVVQKLTGYGTELYAAYEHVEAHRGDRRGGTTGTTGTMNHLERTFDNINAGYFGARVKW